MILLANDEAASGVAKTAELLKQNRTGAPILTMMASIEVNLTLHSDGKSTGKCSEVRPVPFTSKQCSISRVRAAEAVLRPEHPLTAYGGSTGSHGPTRPIKATPKAIPDVNVGGASRIRGNERCVPPAPAPSSPCAGFSVC